MKKMKSILPIIILGFAISLFPAQLVPAQPATPAMPEPSDTGATGSTEDARYWFDKGALYATYGNEDGAIKAFEKSIAIDPEYSEAYFHLGVVYGEKGDYRKAIDAINRAIGMEPENDRFYYGRGWAYRLADKNESAMADFRKAAELGNPEAKKYLEEIVPRTPKM